MLKIKEELHYRRGYTHAHCSDCNHYVQTFKRESFNGADLGEEPRCRVIGLQLGRMYRIHPKNICDQFDNSELLARLKGGLGLL